MPPVVAHEHYPNAARYLPIQDAINLARFGSLNPSASCSISCSFMG